MGIQFEVKINKWEWDKALCGGSCAWISGKAFIGCEWFGVKVYDTEGHAWRAMCRQRRAWSQGLAPAVGPIVRAIIKRSKFKDKIMYGYLSAEADQQELPNIDSSQWTLLERKLELAGFESADACQVNCGWYNGKLVMLDFDDVSSS